MHQHRLAALREALAAADLTAAVISRPQHLFYLTGAMPGAAPSYLVVTGSRAVAAADEPIEGMETILYSSYDIWRGWDIVGASAAGLDEALHRCGVDRGPLGAELAHVPVAHLGPLTVRSTDLRDLEPYLWRQRKNKDAAEIARIEGNVEANDRAHEAARDALRPGVSEIDLWSAIYRSVCTSAGAPVRLEADLGAGLRGVNPDRQAGNVAVQAGETVFIDIYTARQGYYADTTRVFSLGKPSAKQQEVHDVLAAALRAGEARLQPGTPANVVDTAVRGVIGRAGYGEYFPHHSGHAYGLFQQERPYLIPAETMPLEPGMVVTLEPGIYIPGWGGMRLEGNWVIEQGGPRRLDHFPTELIICPA